MELVMIMLLVLAIVMSAAAIWGNVQESGRISVLSQRVEELQALVLAKAPVAERTMNRSSAYSVPKSAWSGEPPPGS